jgi:RNA polymerase sigma-70 factor (ECF subfamily)
VDERELTARVKLGDEVAERALYDAHVDRVYWTAYRMSGRHDLAQDFTQDVFIRAFDRIKDYRGDAPFGAWLHTITTSVVLNGLRKVKRFDQREAVLEEAAMVTSSVRESEPDLKERLAQAIEALPEGCRVTFLMHDVEGSRTRRSARRSARLPARRRRSCRGRGPSSESRWRISWETGYNDRQSTGRRHPRRAHPRTDDGAVPRAGGQRAARRDVGADRRGAACGPRGGDDRCTGGRRDGDSARAAAPVADRGVRMERAARGRSGARHRDRARTSRGCRHDTSRVAVAPRTDSAPVVTPAESTNTDSVRGAQPNREATQAPAPRSRDIVQPRATRDLAVVTPRDGARDLPALPDSTVQTFYRTAALQTLAQAEALLIAYRGAENVRDPAAMQQAARWARDVSRARGCSWIPLRDATRRCARCSPIWS